MYYLVLLYFGLLGAYKRHWHCQNQTIYDDIRIRTGFEILENIAAMGPEIEKGGPYVSELVSTFEEDGEEECRRPGADDGNHAFGIAVERFATEYPSIEEYH